MTVRELGVRTALFLLTLALAGCAAPATFSGTGTQPTGEAPFCLAPCLREIDHGTRWEPMVAIDPTDSDHFVASSHDQDRDPVTGRGGSWALSHVTFDGGASWRTVRLPGGPTSPPTHPLFRYNSMDDSAIAFLPDGTLLWSVTAKDEAAGPTTGYSLVVLRSTDGGLTFPDVTTVQEGAGGDVGLRPVLGGNAKIAFDAQDKQWFAIEPDGTAVLVWSRNGGGNPACPSPSPFDECTRLVFSTSSDGGRSWSPLGLIETGLLSGAFPIIREDGGWVVSFRDTRTREARVAVSTDRGASWTSSVIDSTTKFPVLAKGVGPLGERIFMAYPASDAPNHDGPQVVTLRWSDDGGLTWSAALPLDEPEQDGRTLPALASTRDGSVLVTFWHPLPRGAELRAVMFREGVASPTLVLDSTDGPTSDVGDYMGLASHPDGGAFAVWDALRGDGSVLAGARLSER